MTDDAMKGLAQMSQAERIRRCAVEGEEDFAIAFEYLAHALA